METESQVRSVQSEETGEFGVVQAACKDGLGSGTQRRCNEGQGLTLHSAPAQQANGERAATDVTTSGGGSHACDLSSHHARTQPQTGSSKPRDASTAWTPNSSKEQDLQPLPLLLKGLLSSLPHWLR